MIITRGKVLQYGGIAILIIPAIVGLFTIRDYIFPSGPKIEAVGQYDECTIPSDPSSLSLDFATGIWQQDISITNQGNETAKDIKLHTPISGAYVLNNDDPKPFDKQIILPNLQPTDTISLRLWSNNSRYSYLQQATKITYENGATRISYKDRVSSFWVRLIGWVNILWFSILFILIWIPVVLYIDNKNKKQANPNPELK
ncbi:MAG: hypothetical protein Q7S08_01930 [bacterium]|nr:hypothetical protein [bacterium]